MCRYYEFKWAFCNHATRKEYPCDKKEQFCSIKKYELEPQFKSWCPTCFRCPTISRRSYRRDLNSFESYKVPSIEERKQLDEIWAQVDEYSVRYPLDKDWVFDGLIVGDDHDWLCKLCTIIEKDLLWRGEMRMGFKIPTMRQRLVFIQLREAIFQAEVDNMEACTPQNQERRLDELLFETQIKSLSGSSRCPNCQLWLGGSEYDIEPRYIYHTTCGHHFCKPCIRGILHNNKGECPMCEFTFPTLQELDRDNSKSSSDFEPLWWMGIFRPQ